LRHRRTSGLPRHRPDVPEPCPLPFPERARQHDSRCPLPGAGELRRAIFCWPGPFAATGGLQPRPTTSSRHLTSRCAFHKARTALGTLKRVELARRSRRGPSCSCSMTGRGPHHGEVHELGELIKRIRDEFHLSALLVEHHMGLVMESPTTSSPWTTAEDRRRAPPRGPRRPSGGRCVLGRAT